MEFAKRMNRFEAGIFSRLLDMKKERLAAGGAVVDLSIGAPNIPPTQPIMQALADAALDPANYVYAIQDLPELHQAVAGWYQRRYGVTRTSPTRRRRAPSSAPVWAAIRAAWRAPSLTNPSSAWSTRSAAGRRP